MSHEEKNEQEVRSENAPQSVRGIRHFASSGCTDLMNYNAYCVRAKAHHIREGTPHSCGACGNTWGSKVSFLTETGDRTLPLRQAAALGR